MAKWSGCGEEGGDRVATGVLCCGCGLVKRLSISSFFLRGGWGAGWLHERWRQKPKEGKGQKIPPHRTLSGSFAERGDTHDNLETGTCPPNCHLRRRGCAYIGSGRGNDAGIPGTGDYLTTSMLMASSVTPAMACIVKEAVGGEAASWHDEVPCFETLEPFPLLWRQCGLVAMETSRRRLSAASDVAGGLENPRRPKRGRQRLETRQRGRRGNQLQLALCQQQLARSSTLVPW